MVKPREPGPPGISSGMHFSGPLACFPARHRWTTTVNRQLSYHPEIDLVTWDEWRFGAHGGGGRYGIPQAYEVTDTRAPNFACASGVGGYPGYELMTRLTDPVVAVVRGAGSEGRLKDGVRRARGCIGSLQVTTVQAEEGCWENERPG